MSNEILLIAAFTFLLAGVVKGVIGIGLPTISVTILALFVDPRVAIALVMIPSLISNTWQVWQGGQVMRPARLLWPYVVAMMIAMYITSLFAADAPVGLIVTGIGVVVVLWTLTSLWKTPPPLPDRYDLVVQPAAGVLAGILGGMSGIWSPSMVVYLLARRVNKEDFVQFTGFIILCGTIPLALGYITTGLLNRETAIASALMILPTLAGLYVGRQLRNRINNEQFFRVLLIVFCLMGLNLIWRGI